MLIFTLHGKKKSALPFKTAWSVRQLCVFLKKNSDILTSDRYSLDLTIQNDVNNWVANNKPDVVIICAAKVGGIFANNNYPTEFLYQNLMIKANIIHTAYENGVDKLLFLGSSCIYPKHAEQPMKKPSALLGQVHDCVQVSICAASVKAQAFQLYSLNVAVLGLRVNCLGELYFATQSRGLVAQDIKDVRREDVAVDDDQVRRGVLVSRLLDQTRHAAVQLRWSHDPIH